jgi:hypothetical protein
MDTMSSARAAEFFAARGCLALLMSLVALAGCKTPPTNPFLNKPEPDAVATDDDTATKTAEELAAEVQAAFKTTADQARLAATQTVSDAAERGRQVAVGAAANAGDAAQNASALAQVRAVEAMADWPIERAGPLLMVTIAEGNPAASRAAARQLAERWPPAAGLDLNAAATSRAAAVAELRKAWVQQYGEINDAVAQAQAQAQQVADQVNETVEGARQVAYEVQETAQAARESARELQAVAVALKQANLPDAARRGAQAQLEQFAQDANAEVRAQTAQAIGQISDETLIPLLVTMLNDQRQVQQAALDSLTRLHGQDIAAAETTTEDKVRRWQLWYQENPQYRTTRK